MFTNPQLAIQLAREHHRQMLAGARQRHLRRRQRRHPARSADGAAQITRRLTAQVAEPDT